MKIDDDYQEGIQISVNIIKGEINDLIECLASQMRSNYRILIVTLSTTLPVQAYRELFFDERRLAVTLYPSN